MYLYPHKIFSISKDKRLINESGIPVGIYNPTRGTYKDMVALAEKRDACVSILLGEVVDGINLICLDLDDCFDEEGNIDNQTKDFLKEFKEEEYELSTSGLGIHIYILTRMKFDTFIVKEMEGCKSFECYTNNRHIVTTLFDFENVNLRIGTHDKFLQDLLTRVQQAKESSFQKNQEQFVKDVCSVFDGEIINSTEQFRGKMLEKTPVTKISKIREIANKDISLRDIIDTMPDTVDQSQHDAKLVRKLMYYTLSFESAWEMAKKTNYYQNKDDYHKKKFDNPKYIARTKAFIGSGRI